jgi:hypothetical protein
MELKIDLPWNYIEVMCSDIKVGTLNLQVVVEFFSTQLEIKTSPFLRHNENHLKLNFSLHRLSKCRRFFLDKFRKRVEIL